MARQKKERKEKFSPSGVQGTTNFPAGDLNADPEWSHTGVQDLQVVFRPIYVLDCYIISSHQNPDEICPLCPLEWQTQGRDTCAGTGLI